MYNNPYMMNYNQQPNIDRIDAQINELKKMKEQMQKPIQPAINQTFQLSSQNNIKYANTLDDVNKEYVMNDTPFFTKDFSQMWLKSANGNVKIYALEEIIPKDEKDLQIELLQAQIDELKKGMVNHEQYFTNDIKEQNATDTSESNATVRTATKSTKSSSVSKVSRSKKE